jgi:hypothetical protein
VGALLGVGGAGAKVHVGGAGGKDGRKRDRDLTDAELDARELVRWAECGCRCILTLRRVKVRIPKLAPALKFYFPT